MRRWFRSLQAQLFLWAVLPVTFALLALAFTGVYAHQRAMRDFVAERDLALARLTARIIEDGLAHGIVAPDGSGLAAWLPPLVGESVGRAALVVVDGTGQALFHTDPASASPAPSAAPLCQAEFERAPKAYARPEWGRPVKAKERAGHRPRRT